MCLDLEGLDREVILRAVGVLEDRGKARFVVWESWLLINDRVTWSTRYSTSV